jgi:hypothetical protein
MNGNIVSYLLFWKIVPWKHDVICSFIIAICLDLKRQCTVVLLCLFSITICLDLNLLCHCLPCALMWTEK